MFSTYFQLGLEHILDPQAYDHILFVVALTIIYPIKDWKRVLILITAFTIGHSITLALSIFKIVQLNPNFIEALIPITIMITAVGNIFSYGKGNKNHGFNYLVALVFGFVHGLGFSNYLASILGKEESIIGPLFAFNIGVEAGQVIIVIITLMLSYILVDLLKLNRKYFVVGLSAIILAVATWLLFR